MSRINTNVTAMTSTRILNQNNSALNTSLERLSTGIKINRGADDPAGLIASENLNKQITGAETGIKNAERASTIIATADGALSEISNMLSELQGLLGEAANTGGMSSEEIEANQLQADSILNSIDRIANSTEFEGIKLLNGNYDYTVSGANTTTFTSAISDLKVRGAKLIDGAAMTVAVSVTTSAQTAKAYLSGDVANNSLSLKIGSNRGNTELTFASGTSVANVATSINAVKEVTGVSATVSASNEVIKLNTVDYGTDAYISVEQLSSGTNNTRILGSDATSGAYAAGSRNEFKDFGVDAIATINGTQAVADGKDLSIKTAMLDVKMTLTDDRATNTGSSTFTITGGGADFSIGSTVDAINLESLGIADVSSSSLGTSDDGRLSTLKSGGANSLNSDNLYTAQRVLSHSVKQVSELRGRLGSFQANTLEKTINNLTVTKENLSSAQSAITDTDFASETSAMTRAQILVQSATSVLSQANSTPQNILQLL